MQNIVLSPSFEVTSKENQALHHYKTYLAKKGVTKNVLWSSHMVMLCYGSQTPMVMHLLIAVSLIDLAVLQHDDEAKCFAAQQHFRAGAYLLIETMNSGAELDHVLVLTAFFFLYKFMENKKDIDATAMTQLSKTVRDHITKYNLDMVSAKPLPSHLASTEIAVTVILPRDKREFLAKLIVLLFYQDVKAALQGCGGSLANHLHSDPEQTSEIYQHSTTSLESSWGTEYPESEIVDDLENGPILKFLCDVMALYTDVNVACQLPQGAVTEAEKVEEKITRLEDVS
jgi:hypothetical protein